jgi:hypothetical protein
VIVGLLCIRLWFYIPGVLPLLVLSHNRGGALVLAVGIAGRYMGKVAAASVVLTALGLIVIHPSVTDIERMQIWQAAYINLRWFGLGVGTFTDLWMQIDGVMERPEFAHNDYIEFAFEYGIGALAVYCLIAWTFARTLSTEWPVFAGFAALALFYFPLHTPLTAFIGCVAAGSIARNRMRVCGLQHNRRSDFLAGASSQRYVLDAHSGKIVSMEP